MGDKHQLQYYGLQSPRPLHCTRCLSPGVWVMSCTPSPASATRMLQRGALSCPLAVKAVHQQSLHALMPSFLVPKPFACPVPARLWITKVTLQSKKCYIFTTDLYFSKSPQICCMTERTVIIPFFHSSLSTVTQVTVVKAEKEPSGPAQGTQFESFKAALLYGKRLLGQELR